MDSLSPTLLLKLALCAYAAAALGSLLSLRREKLANAVGFGGAILAGALGIGAALVTLVYGVPAEGPTFELWPCDGDHAEAEQRDRRHVRLCHARSARDQICQARRHPARRPDRRKQRQFAENIKSSK